MTQFERYQQELSKEYQRKFFMVVNEQDGDIDAALIDLKKEVERIVRRNTRFDNVDEGSIRTPLKEAIIAFMVLYGSTLTDYNVNVVRLQGELMLKRLEQYDNGVFNDMVEKGTGALIVDTRKYFLKADNAIDGRSVADRIRFVQAGALKVVNDIITTDIKDEVGAKQLISDIQNYIRKDDRKLWVGPFDWYRTRFGYKVNVVPVGRPMGSIDYNVFRIARTEINNSWRNATIKLNEGKRWVTGYRWNLSYSHPKQDICDDWAIPVYKTEKELPDGHPHCMCYVTADMVDPSEIDI